MKLSKAIDEKISFLFLLACNNFKKANNKYNFESKSVRMKEEKYNL